MTATHDVVVVGGGHHGLTCAAYLGRAGVDVCILEGRHEWGGALYTGEHTAPGFCHNIHAKVSLSTQKERHDHEN